MKLVSIKDGSLTTTSKIVSDVFGKVHRNIIRSIEDLECSDEFRVRNFEHSYYTSPQNKKISCYNITKDGFYFLCMGFTGKKAAQWKESFINTFNELEKGVVSVDKKMTELSRNSKELKALGSEWSKFGHEINKKKKEHEKAVKSLIDKVQLNLDFNKEGK